MLDLHWEHVGVLSLQLGSALLVGGLVGIERRVHRRWAGPRTYMFVSMGAAIFAIIGQDIASTDPAAVTRIVQGIAAGIGFLGAGTILKLSGQLEVRGLTTAGSIWVAAALGTACGLSLYPLVIVGTVLSLLILAVFRPIEKHFEASLRRREPKP